MLRHALPFAVAFVIACIGGSGIVVVRAKAAAAAIAAVAAAQPSPATPDAKPDSANAADSVGANAAPAPGAAAGNAATPAGNAATPAGNGAAPPGSAAAPAGKPAGTLPAAGNVAAGVPAPASAGQSTTGGALQPTTHAANATAPLTPATLVNGRLAKIFTAMPAKEAAKVLEQMDNADVTAILGGVSDKRAAEILALFPAARAAELSKTALRPRGDTK